MISLRAIVVACLSFLVTPAESFAPRSQLQRSHVVSLRMEQDDLQKKFGGYTAKQRLREEVESPFRTVRLFLFGSSTGSAGIALYFSILSAIKAAAGGFSDAPPLDEALQSCGINVAALLFCGFITYRDWQAGNANLARIAKGGALAKLTVVPASAPTAVTTLADYRRTSRVLICAGGAGYIQKLCLSLTSDQRTDANVYSQGLEASDVIVVPVVLEGDGSKFGDSMKAWKDTAPGEDDKNFDVERASNIICFPRGPAAWEEYLKSEVETCQKQGFDVLEKGFTIFVKKNGRILRRATGQPQLSSMIDTMEIMDGSKFGMPGDDEKYGA